MEMSMTMQRNQSKQTANEEARKELLASDSDPTTIRRRRSEQQAAQNVTTSLMELREMLSSDLKRNEETMHVLINSSGTLGDTKKEMETIRGSVNIGSRLITKFRRREFTDKVLIFLGLVFFFGVILYILQKRLLYWIW